MNNNLKINYLNRKIQIKEWAPIPPPNHLAHNKTVIISSSDPLRAALPFIYFSLYLASYFRPHLEYPRKKKMKKY